MLIYGHRGAKGEAPENTLAGFEHAYRHGVRRFEMDIQLSADGVPVVVHDLTVDRTTEKQGKIASFSAAELDQMDARRGGPPWRTPVGIPRLDAVFESCPAFEHMQLEVKTDSWQRLNSLCNRLVELVQQRRWQSRIILTSSDERFLQAVKRRDAQIRIGLVAERRYPNPVKTATSLGCDYLCLRWTLCKAETVLAAHNQGLHVSAWTVNRIHDMLELEAQGVDSIITDYPTSTRTYFESRTQIGPLTLTGAEQH
ncbi:glycerophosphodiester phosphodiesterase [Hydrocarboniclastica marina]|uniref:Glycerophosphodiester phosphodiesterase n=1 Tax=Hydrocarboniclastica marina TaxID=2259620 RepID=A0A4P7XFV0_9ALTE|nr:glycerophosphodiester phosphodiesterase [Hydrocarboniclastica marina]MAL98684.1 glycerophosphodiester phosphodiesterase [Alteromonadaceae bacterium]QCF25575.1 glycerophosphodiester phosphodiesterase [Hydrocarboniclastica marina]|tara:strand:+ start:1134 stop:1898 length:765 start_codon:yes stop_codon:yes gene_type:complete